MWIIASGDSDDGSVGGEVEDRGDKEGESTVEGEAGGAIG